MNSVIAVAKPTDVSSLLEMSSHAKETNAALDALEAVSFTSLGTSTSERISSVLTWPIETIVMIKEKISSVSSLEPSSLGDDGDKKVRDTASNIYSMLNSLAFIIGDIKERRNVYKEVMIDGKLEQEIDVIQECIRPILARFAKTYRD